MVDRKKKKKIIVAMSGGVDSSVAAKLLVDQGHDVVGVFLHFWKDEQSGGENKCCSLESLMDARRVCKKIGIKLYTLNFREEFKRNVVDYFLHEYAAGRTPNPCVKCNKFVKLGLLIKRAKELGYDYVASGHYVISKIEKNKESVRLFKGVDDVKDQSYFLNDLSQEQLKHLIFPLGKFKKNQVRKMAREFGLPVAEKRESQEICFVSASGHNEFLKKYLKLKSGPIKILGGKTIGEHNGLPLYTIGQRKGIDIGGTGPFYAASFDYKKNILYVVKDRDHSLIYNDSLMVKKINWTSGQEPKLPLKCQAVIRYGHKADGAQIHKKNKNYLIKFSEPQRAIAPGQSVVFYLGDEMIGGGVII
ncbi:MAG: tRNA 2-thiouridine(34) synthase MnmA [bacterium]